jgi:hypothetical protein
MEMLNATIEISNYRYTYEKPNACPHCGITMDAKAFLVYTGNTVALIIFQCTREDCRKVFYATYGISSETKTLVFHYMYPHPQMKDMPDTLLNFSAAFADKCRQAYAAELNGHYELAACGYRNAVEALVKDYAISTGVTEGLPGTELTKKSIDACIKEYLPDIDVTVATYFTKEEGNKATHYPPIEGDEFDFSEFKLYFALFVSTMNTKIELRNRRELLPARHLRKFDLPQKPLAPPPEEGQ